MDVVFNESFCASLKDFSLRHKTEKDARELFSYLYIVLDLTNWLCRYCGAPPKSPGYHPGLGMGRILSRYHTKQLFHSTTWQQTKNKKNTCSNFLEIALYLLYVYLIKSFLNFYPTCIVSDLIVPRWILFPKSSESINQHEGDKKENSPLLNRSISCNERKTTWKRI